MRADDHAGRTIARGTVRIGLNPDRRPGIAAGEFLQQVEGAGQDMVAGDL